MLNFNLLSNRRQLFRTFNAKVREKFQPYVDSMLIISYKAELIYGKYGERHESGKDSETIEGTNLSKRVANFRVEVYTGKIQPITSEESVHLIQIRDPQNAEATLDGIVDTMQYEVLESLKG